MRDLFIPVPFELEKSDLDFGIYRVMDLRKTQVETYLAKIKVIKRVGKIIIDFLAQIEDFRA